MKIFLTLATLLYAGTAYAQQSPSNLIFSSPMLNKPSTLNLSGDSAERIVITRPKNCTMVILENTFENIVLGCRKEIKP